MAKKEEDNSVLEDHESYVGVDPIYQNAADVALTPMDGDEDDEVLDRVKELEEQRKVGVNKWGSGTDAPHPTEAETPNSKLVKEQQTLRAAEVARAEQTLAGGEQKQQVPPVVKNPKE
jgi:hypothetical protein